MNSISKTSCDIDWHPAVWLGIVLVVLQLTGCAPLGNDNQSLRQLEFSPSRIAQDAVALEVGIAQLDTSQIATLKRYWRTLDQQELPLATRQQLDRHGLKVGIMSARSPASFSKLVAPREVVIDELDAFQKQLYLSGHLQATNRMISHKRISNRKGESHPVATSAAHPNASWTLYRDGGSSAQSSNNVIGIFKVQTYPQGDGSVRIVIRPEIHHGQLASRYGATANGFRFETQQAVETLDHLEFEAPLRAGETLVIGPTADIDQLGNLFFGEIQPSQDSELVRQADRIQADRIQADRIQADRIQADRIQADRITSTETPTSQQTQSTNQLPDLGIDESKFDDLVQHLNIDSVNRSLTETIDGELQQPAVEKPKPLHRILMIRVVQTQLDDLFDQQVGVEPLTTSREF